MPHTYDTDIGPANIVIFGGAGNVARTKILPALYKRFHAEVLPNNTQIILVDRNPLQKLSDYKKDLPHTKSFKGFITLLRQVAPDNLDAIHDTTLMNDGVPLVFYLATPPEAFVNVVESIDAAGLISNDARLVVEKPLGHDLNSFKEIDKALRKHFREDQIYRIDHYLGKETVQNLMVLRFGNHLFEQVWNQSAIEHVEISVLESAGVEERAAFYNKTGALRDMVQNHLLQLLCLVAMDPPATLKPDAIRTEKLKVLESLSPVTAKHAANFTVRGQYEGYPVEGSDTETYVALKTEVNNWRWAGVPFYLRTGKALTERYSEIVIHFKPVPHDIFPNQSVEPERNKLIIRLQPNEGLSLQMVTKIPGPGGFRFKPVMLDLCLHETFKDEEKVGSYERLMMDVIRGIPTLFMTRGEVEAAWEWTDRVLRAWVDEAVPLHRYAVGSHGPDAADVLLQQAGLAWHSED